MRHLLLVLATSTILTQPARADQVLPRGQTTNGGDIQFGALKRGTRQNGKTTPNPDAVQLDGPITCTVAPCVAPAALPLSKLFGRLVDVEDFRLPADGTDWGPAFERARQSIASTGGVIQVSTPGILTIATQTTFPKGNPFVLLRCASQATVIKNAASLTTAMFRVGGASAAGSSDFEIEACTFTGASTTASYAFHLQNANTVTFRRAVFTNMSVAIESAAGFALTLDGVAANGVINLFHSSTPAHNFVAQRNRVYGGGTTYKFDGGNTDNLSIVEGDYEGTGTVVQMAGGTALRFVGNYAEYMKADLINCTAACSGSDVSNNWIALGNTAGVTGAGTPVPWNIGNFVGGQIKGNSTYNQYFNIAAGTVNVEIGDNIAAGFGALPPSPYQTPTLTNAWMQQANYSPVGFRKGRDGRVYLRGALINPGQNLKTAAFTLPAGYRPRSQRTFIAGNSSSAITQISINGDGNVVIVSVGNAGAGTPGNPYQAGLDGISFEPGT